MCYSLRNLDTSLSPSLGVRHEAKEFSNLWNLGKDFRSHMVNARFQKTIHKFGENFHGKCRSVTQL